MYNFVYEYEFDLYVCMGEYKMNIVIMNEQKIEGMPEGWRLVRIGRPKVGEWFLDSDNGEPLLATCDWLESVRVIVERILKYRNVTQDDVGKMVEINIGGYWYERKLLAVLPEKFDNRYIYETAGGNIWTPTDDARIKD